MLTGRAGGGKTRLALELCEQMLAEGWDAGFLASGELERFRAQQNLATWGWQRPTLIVSDYAAVHAEILNSWFQELADNQGDSEKPLRILLLERNAERGSGWWQTAFGRGGFGAHAVQRLLDPPEPVSLLPMAASDERRRVIGEALKEAESDQRPPDEGTDPVFDRQLAELTWGGEPLFLMMAALMAKEIGMANVLSLGRTDLAFALAERELARLAEIGKANGVNPDFMEAIAAYVTLCRGLDAAQIRAAVAAERNALGLPSAGDAGVVADLLCDTLPGENGAAPILPDMIGEAAILRALLQYYNANSAHVVVRGFEQVGPQAAATVIRTAQDFAGQVVAGKQIVAPLHWLDAVIDRGSVDVDQLMLIANALPQTSLALAEHGARIYLVIERALRAEVASGAEHRLPVLAIALNNLAGFLSEVGQRQEALASAQEAADLYRELAAKAPDAYRPDLAMAFNNLANRLSEVGRRQEALVPAQDAADLYRELAAKAPDAYRPDLASALNNLASSLSEVGRRQEALAPAQEAVAIRHELVAKAPDAYRPDLAGALQNLANRLSEVGRRHEALAPAREAADLYRGLAAKAPDAHRPDLAGSLNSLANLLREGGRCEEALSAAKEAVAISRKLAAKAPDAYRPDLARAMGNLATILSAVDKRQEALAVVQEAADIFCELAAKAPNTWRPDLATALNNLASSLSEVGQHQEALAPAQQAVAIRRELASKAPDAYRPDLAVSLMMLANCLDRAGNSEDAIERNAEAIHEYTPGLLALPEAYADRASAMAQEYLERCEKLGRERNAELLAPIVDMLQRMHEGRAWEK